MIQPIKNLLNNYSNKNIKTLNVKERYKYNLLQNYYGLEKEIVNKFNQQVNELNKVKNITQNELSGMAQNYEKNLKLYLRYNGLDGDKRALRDYRKGIEDVIKTKSDKVTESTESQITKLEQGYQKEIDSQFEQYNKTIESKKFLEKLDESRVGHFVDNERFSIGDTLYTVKEKATKVEMEQSEFINAVRNQGFYSTTDTDIPNGFYVVTTEGLFKKKRIYVYKQGTWYKTE